MSTPAKINTNKINAAKSTGPNDTSVTRYNALKTGLTARNLTKLDKAAGYQVLLEHLHAELNPVGLLEKYLAERIALGMVRRCRGEHLEAAFIDRDLQRKTGRYALQDDDDKTAPPLSANTVADLCNLATRYETATARRLEADIKLLINLQKQRGNSGFVS